MTKRTILYYPTINVPTTSWLRHSLLYWDEVSSIVPQNWDRQYLSKLSPDINYLISEGEFRPISPETLIQGESGWDMLRNFENDFKNVITSKEFKAFLEKKPFFQSRINTAKLPPPEYDTRIHQNKTSGNLYNFLANLGLAHKDRRNNHEWYLFERHTALIYMSLLAKYLAAVDKNQTTIGTNFSVYEKFNFKRVNKTDGYPIVSINLNNVLPSPAPNVPLEKIIDFKRRRQDELIYFRKSLMSFQNKVSKAKSNEELKEIVISYQEEIRVGIKGISDTLKDYRMEFITKSLKSLISLKSPTAWLSAASLADEKFHFLGTPISAKFKIAGILAVGAIELKANYIEVKNKALSKTRESAFSYLLQAQRSGIVKASR